MRKKDFFNIAVPSINTKVLEFDQYQKPYKVLFVIYVDLECLIEKNDGCKNNPEKSQKASMLYPEVKTV